MKCKCSERPLAIIESKVEIQENIPYQILIFACTNKQCSEYKKPVYKQFINLMNTAETQIIKL